MKKKKTHEAATWSLKTGIEKAQIIPCHLILKLILDEIDLNTGRFRTSTGNVFPYGELKGPTQSYVPLPHTAGMLHRSFSKESMFI